MDALHLDRSETYQYGLLSARQYNLAIGGLLFYGFAVNALICFFLGDFFFYAAGGSAVLFLIAYVICVLLSVALSSSPSALVNFIGYNLLVLPIGVVVSMAVAPASVLVVRSALVGTGVFLFLMVAAAWARPDFFLSLETTLGVSLVVTIIAEVILFFLGISTGWMDYLVVAIFSLYLGFDWARSQQCAPTLRNAILSASQIYLDVINIFVRLLSILSRNRDN